MDEEYGSVGGPDGFGPCGVITGTGARRARCLEDDVLHRGPHWKNVEPISCDCKFACPGHPGRGEDIVEREQRVRSQLRQGLDDSIGQRIKRSIDQALPDMPSASPGEVLSQVRSAIDSIERARLRILCPDQEMADRVTEVVRQNAIAPAMIEVGVSELVDEGTILVMRPHSFDLTRPLTFGN